MLSFLEHTIKSFRKSTSHLVLPFIDLEFSLRQLISRLDGVIPADSDRIDSIISSFSTVFSRNNTDKESLLSNKDICYIVTFSIILLNTDLHHSNNEGRRMTQQQFQLNTWKSINQIICSSCHSAPPDSTFLSATETTMPKIMLELQILFDNIRGCELGSEIILPPPPPRLSSPTTTLSSIDGFTNGVNISGGGEDTTTATATNNTEGESQNQQRQTPLLEGYLLKKGDGYWGDWKWRKRYFRLIRKNPSSPPILMYSNFKELPPKAAISLKGVNVRSLNRDGKFMFCLIPQKTDEFVGGGGGGGNQSEEMETLNAFSLLSGFTLSSLTVDSTSSATTLTSALTARTNSSTTSLEKIRFAKGISKDDWIIPASLKRDSFTFEASSEKSRDLWVQGIRAILYNNFGVQRL